MPFLLRRRTEDWESLSDKEYFQYGNLCRRISPRLADPFMVYVRRWWNLFSMPMVEFRGGLAQIADENAARAQFSDRREHRDLQQYNPACVYVPCDDDDWLTGMSYVQDLPVQTWGTVRLRPGGEPRTETIDETKFVPTNAYAVRGDLINRAVKELGRQKGRSLVDQHTGVRNHCKDLGLLSIPRTAGPLGVHVLSVASTTHAVWKPLSDEEILTRVGNGGRSAELEGFESECDRLAELYRQLHASVRLTANKV